MIARKFVFVGAHVVPYTFDRLQIPALTHPVHQLIAHSFAHDGFILARIAKAMLDEIFRIDPPVEPAIEPDAEPTDGTTPPSDPPSTAPSTSAPTETETSG